MSDTPQGDTTQRDLGRLEGQMAGIEKALRDIRDGQAASDRKTAALEKNMGERFDKIDTRLRNQEIRAGGLATVAGALASVAVALFGGNGGGPQT